VVTFASAALAGVPLLLHEGFSLGQLREMGKEEKREVAGALPPGSTQAALEGLEEEMPHELPAADHCMERRGDDRE
jgi:hypothetical protein